MSEAACATLSLFQNIRLLPLCLFVAGDDHLCDAVAIIDGEGHIGQVDEDDTDLTAVVGIDGAWGVQHRHTMFDGHPAAGTHLRFHACRQRHEQTRRHQYTCQGSNLHRRIQIRT